MAKTTIIRLTHTRDWDGALPLGTTRTARNEYLRLASLFARLASGAGEAQTLEVETNSAAVVRASGTATLGAGLAAGEKVTINAVDFVAALKHAENKITCAAVQAADTVTVNDVELTAVANGETPGDAEFEVGAGGTANADTGVNLMTAIVANCPGVGASHSNGVVTVTALVEGKDGNDIPIATSSGTRLAITTAGGKLAGAYDPGSNEWPVESSLSLSAVALAARANACATVKILDVIEASPSGAVVTFRAKAPGKGGNLVTLAKTGAHITVSGTGNFGGGAGENGTRATYSRA